MPREEVIKCTCDICGKSEISEKVPEGWIEWSQDHPAHSRSWIERIICNICTKNITDAVKRKEDAKK